MQLWQFIELLTVKVGANLRSEVSRYYLNYLWWIIEPVMTMLVFYIVFGLFLNNRMPNFIGFLLVGLVTWNWFAHSVTNSMNSIIQGRALMYQLDITKLFFPLVVLFQDLFKHLFVQALLLVFLLIYPTPVGSAWFTLPVLMFIQFTLVAGTSIFCAALVPFVPDLRFIIMTGIQLLFFASGIFYNIDSVVLPKHRFIIYLNPMAGLLREYRKVLLENTWPDWMYLAGVFCFGLIFLGISVSILFRLDKLYPKICQI